MTLVYLAAAWLAGIALAAVVSAGQWWVWAGLGIPALIGAVLARRNPAWRIVFGCAFMVSLGAIRYTLAIPRFDQGDLATYNDSGFVTIEGLIVDAPDVRDTHINLRVHAETITFQDGVSRPVEGVALVQAPRVGQFRYGDPVRVIGELRTPPIFEEFSYRDYLAREGVYSYMQYTQVEVIGERRGNPIRVALLDFRAHAHSVIMRLLPDPQASLLSGILLGIESGISTDVRESFDTVGASHVIAISGANLAIVAGLVQGLARRVMRETPASILTIIVVLGYAIFVGGDPAVIRAAIMVTLGLVALRLGRQTYGLASLAFAALFMTAINPLTLWDVGFQLSFLATLGLILYTEPLEAWLERVLERLTSAERAQALVGAVSEAFVVTIAAQITTTPLMALTFGRLSLLSLPVNFLIIPAQTPLMVFGGIAVLLALVVWPLGQLFAWLAWLFLSYTLVIVRGFAGLPLASLEVRDVSPGAIWAIYAALFGLTAIASLPEDQRTGLKAWLGRAFSVKVVGSAGLLVAALIGVGAWSLPDGQLHVTVIDVGEGTATLIETPSGRQILVDGGGSGRALSTALGDALPFWDRQLDLLVITQPTRDHVGGLLPTLERYRFDAVLYNGVRGDSDLTQAIWAELDAQGVRGVIALPGMQVAVADGVTLTVLHTQRGPAPEDDPGQPVVLLLAYGDARFLLTGDLTPEGAAALLAEGVRLDATVLQVPVGGQQAMGDEAFLAAVNPQMVVFSMGAGSRSGSPDEAVLAHLDALGTILFRTDQHGTIRLRTDGHTLTVVTARR